MEEEIVISKELDDIHCQMDKKEINAKDLWFGDVVSLEDIIS
jgi:hypothetical protein